MLRISKPLEVLIYGAWRLTFVVENKSSHTIPSLVVVKFCTTVKSGCEWAISLPWIPLLASQTLTWTPMLKQWVVMAPVACQSTKGATYPSFLNPFLNFFWPFSYPLLLALLNTVTEHFSFSIYILPSFQRRKSYQLCGPRIYRQLWLLRSEGPASSSLNTYWKFTICTIQCVSSSILRTSSGLLFIMLDKSNSEHI